MKTLVPLIFVLLSFAFWLAVSENSDLGKNPKNEEVIFTQERSKVTGQLLNVEIVRCRECGQVISYVQYGLNGKVVYGYVHSHVCNKYKNNLITQYNGSGVWPTHFNLIDWLKKWQRRLRLAH